MTIISRRLISSSKCLLWPVILVASSESIACVHMTMYAIAVTMVQKLSMYQAGSRMERQQSMNRLPGSVISLKKCTAEEILWETRVFLDDVHLEATPAFSQLQRLPRENRSPGGPRRESKVPFSIKTLSMFYP